MKGLTEKKYWDAKYSKIQTFIDSGTFKTKLTKLILRRILGKNFLKYVRSYSDFLLWEKILTHYLPRGKKLKVLEVGSAPGFFLLKFKKKFNYIPFGVEFSDFGARLNKKIFELNRINPENIIHTNFLSDMFQNHNKGRFDIVISRGFIEHFFNVKKVIEKHLNVLKKEGFLIISIPNIKGFNYVLAKTFNKSIIKQHNLKIMTKNTFAALFKDNNLKNLFCDYYGTFKFGLISAKEGSILRFIKKALDNLQLILNFIFFFLLKEKGLESRLFSPYLLFIGVKKN